MRPGLYKQHTHTPNLTSQEAGSWIAIAIRRIVDVDVDVNHSEVISQCQKNVFPKPQPLALTQGATRPIPKADAMVEKPNMVPSKKKFDLLALK